MEEDQVYSAAEPRELRALCDNHGGTSVGVAHPCAHTAIRLGCTRRHGTGSYLPQRAGACAGMAQRHVGCPTAGHCNCHPLRMIATGLTGRGRAAVGCRGLLGGISVTDANRDAGITSNKAHYHTGCAIRVVVGESERGGSEGFVRRLVSANSTKIRTLYQSQAPVTAKSSWRPCTSMHARNIGFNFRWWRAMTCLGAERTA